MTAAEVDRIRSEVQGNILDPYRLACVRHVVVRVVDPAGARGVLAEMLRPGGPVPAITSDEPYDGPQRSPCVNVGFTCAGLEALGVPAAMLRTFPPEFREGMAARAGRLGDFGASAPQHWVPSLRRWRRVHLVLTVHAETPAATAATAARVLAAGGGALVELGHFDGEALVQTESGGYDLYNRVAEVRDDGTPITRKRGEHFGFRDGFAQPRFEGVRRVGAGPDEAHHDPRSEPYEPLGVVLLGHPTLSPVAVPVPKPHELGHQGSFNAFRVLAQDVAGFRGYVAGQARELGIDEELLKAKMCGRWPNGVPLSLAATADKARELAATRRLNDFDFSDDQDGADCPVGSHIRRCNPRAAVLVQRPANRARRLVRRGMPFGPWLEEGAEAGHPRERGMLGSFLCASLSTQFEAMQYDWINLGLQDPSITSTNDPLLGANDPATSRFTFSDGERWRTVRGLPRFVETMGGAYCFLPSMRGLRWIASGGWLGEARGGLGRGLSG